RSFATSPQKISSEKSQGYFAKARELITFYKNGIKQLWENQKIARQLRAKRDEDPSSLTRRELQLACIRTAELDRSKLIPFALTLITVAELLPLLVIMAPFLVPSTCVTPEQLEKTRRKLYEKQQAIRNELLKESNVVNVSICEELAKDDFQNLQRMIQLQKTIEVSKNGHFKIHGPEHIGHQKNMLQKEGVAKLTIDELSKASQERGIQCVDTSKSQMRYALHYWISLHLNEDPEISDFLLMFSRVFLLNAKYLAVENESLPSGKKKKEIIAQI
ncbi:8939_t:CDS:2, partial [Ambispora leptoticha]